MATTIEQDQKKQNEIRNAARSGETREMQLPTAPKGRRRVAMGIGALVAILALIWGTQKYSTDGPTNPPTMLRLTVTSFLSSRRWVDTSQRLPSAKTIK